ncbi:MAG: hypothetical protein IPM64_05105 [Phycisphaerales bacterium]|nr:hypothetical protein [Phycisphaerales bacterium]
MLVEVHAGGRPGRPVVLLLLVSAALASSLGLAFSQVVAKRALGSPRTLPGTPLTFRAPAQWTADSKRPGEFFLALHEGDREGLGRIERRVRFGYRRHSTFVPPEVLVRAMDLSWQELGRSFDPAPAVVAGIPGLQVTRQKLTPFRGRMLAVQTVLRIACTAAGEEVLIEYTPLTDLTFADVEMLDDLSRAMVIERGGAERPAAQIMDAAGIRVTIPAGTVLEPPALEGVRGFAFVGREAGLPRFAVNVYRTWMHGSRAPTDLVRDCVVERWRVPADLMEVEEQERGDGARVAWVNARGPRSTLHPLRSIGVVKKGARDAALVLVHADEMFQRQADAAGRAIAVGLELEPGFDGVLEAAEAAGAEFPPLLRERGAVPWWGVLRDAEVYLGQIGGVPFELRRQRAALSRDEGAGFEGVELAAHGSKRDLLQWTVDGTGVGYSADWELDFGPPGMTRRIEVRERRGAEGGAVKRTLSARGARGDLSFRPGPAFVPPPIESLIPLYVHSKAAGSAWLFEVSAPLCDSTRFVLFSALGEDGSGASRVLLQDDVAPEGVIFEVREGVMTAIRTPDGGELRRVADRGGP